jgi:hypothetical protein
MARVDQACESMRTAISSMWGEGMNAIVTPSSIAGELRDWHDLNVRNA